MKDYYYSDDNKAMEEVGKENDKKGRKNDWKVTCDLK